MDFGQEILLGLFLAFIAWILTITLHHNFVALFSILGTAMFLVPMVFITLSGMLEMQSVSSNVTTVTEVGNKTTTSLLTFVANNIQGIVASDVVGAIVGFIAGLFTTAKTIS